MAHKQKFTRGAVGHMLGHYDRSKEVPDLAMPGNTELNYNLAQADQPMEQLDFLHKRLSEVKVHNRKDVNVMVDWVVTLPQTLKNQGIANEERFFEEAYKFLNERYGKENVISAYVHMDEVTPHMHYAFVPVVEDRKKGGYKLSAKEAVTREDLRTFHKDLSDHMERVFGRDIGILNEATKEGNKSITELKRGTAIESLKEVEKDVSRGLQTVQKLRAEADGIQREMERDIMTSRQVKEVPHSKALIGDKQVLSTEDFNALCKTASIAEALLKEIKPARKINAREKEILAEAQEKANAIVKGAERQAGTMNEKLESIKYRRKLEEVEKVINSSPSLARAFNEQARALESHNRSHKRGLDLER